ncbi:MAG: 50S ribosomal protein L33 [bacterium]
MRERVILVCTECLSRNYSTYKNKQSSVKRLELKKYCRTCNKHTIHRESK